MSYHFKTISQGYLYWLKRLYLPSDQNNDCAKCVQMNGYFQNHLPSRTLLTHRALLQETSIVTMLSLFSQFQHQVACHFRPSPQYNSTYSKSSVFGGLNNGSAASFPISPLYCLPLQDHIWGIPLLTRKSSILGDLKSNHAVSPHGDMWQLCQYICLKWTHCSHQCDQKHCHTYILHYWHISLNRYTHHIAHICATACLL